MNEVEKLWHDCSDALWRFILKRVSDRREAEDILQDVFLKIQTVIGDLRDVRKIRPWLYRISRNAIIDHYRAKKPMAELPEHLQAPDPAARAEEEELSVPCINEMIDRLPDKYRQAVELTVYQGLTQKEMGERLGLSVSGAKSRVQRAREKLKDLLCDCCTFELDGLGSVISYEPKHRSDPDPNRPD